MTPPIGQCWPDGSSVCIDGHLTEPYEQNTQQYPGFGRMRRVARTALVEVLSGVARHRLTFRKAALGTGQHGFRDQGRCSFDASKAMRRHFYTTISAVLIAIVPPARAARRTHSFAVDVPQSRRAVARVHDVRRPDRIHTLIADLDACSARTAFRHRGTNRGMSSRCVL